MSEQKGYKRILQCPLCTKTPLIGLSMDEQSNLFIQTFCKSNGKEVHCCYIGIQKYINSLNKGIIKYINKCKFKGCDYELEDELYCESCNEIYCIDHGLYHKLSKECIEPIKGLLFYKQYNFNCFYHNFELSKAHCYFCQKNICEKCIFKIIEFNCECGKKIIINNKDKNDIYCANCKKKIESNRINKDEGINCCINCEKKIKIKIKFQDEKEEINIIDICENCQKIKNELKSELKKNKKDSIEINLCQNCKKNIYNNSEKKYDKEKKINEIQMIYEDYKKIQYYEDLIRNFNEKKIKEKSKEEFMNLFKNNEQIIKEDKTEFNEKEKWKEKYFKDNKCLIELYEYIYDNYKYLEKINFYDENIYNNFERFQKFNIKEFNSATDPKMNLEKYLKEKIFVDDYNNEIIDSINTTKYDLSKVFLNFIELTGNEKQENIKLFKQDIFQNGHFIGIFDPKCLELISSEIKKHDINNIEVRKVGKYKWNKGDYYIGFFNESNLFHIFGIYYYYNKENGKYYKYIGEFKDGLMEGRGIFFCKDNKQIYDGKWENDEKNGKGKYYWADGYIYEGEYKNNKKNDLNGLIYDSRFNLKKDIINEKQMEDLGIYNDFYYYKGGFKDDYRDGQGIIIYKNNTLYKGEFKFSKKHGKGKLISLSNKEIIKEGEWKDNKFVGEITNS